MSLSTLTCIQIRKLLALSLLYTLCSTVQVSAIKGDRHPYNPPEALRPKTNTRLKKKESPVRRTNIHYAAHPDGLVKAKKCKFLRPDYDQNGTGGKAGHGKAKAGKEGTTTTATGTDVNGGVRRRRRAARQLNHAAAPNIAYNEQIAQKVYVDSPASATALRPPPKDEDDKAPPGYVWDFGLQQGEKKDPNDEYVTCEAPSTTPSVSLEPTPTPSNSPTRYPTPHPSPSPSWSPTLSHNPTVSQQPSLSYMPSGMPTYPNSPGCDELHSGGVFDDTNDAREVPSFSGRTGNFEPDYYYELITMSDADMNIVGPDIDNVLRQALGERLIWCGVGKDDERRFLKGMQKVSHGRMLNTTDDAGFDENVDEISKPGDWLIDGISLNDWDVVQTDRKCSSKTLENVEQNQECKVYKGDFKVYANDRSTITDDQYIAHVLKAIELEIDGDPDTLPLKEKIESENPDTDVVKVVYGTGEEVPDDDNSGPSGLNRGPENPAESGITYLGGAIISLASVAMLLFIFAASRKRQSHKVRVHEEFMEEDESIFGKGAGTDLMSNGSDNQQWRTARGAHVLGEDDSVFSDEFDSEDIMADIRKAERSRLYGMGKRGLALGPQEGNLGASGEQVNVHSCTSATCPICAGGGAKKPLFVDTALSDIDEEDDSRIAEMCTPSYDNTVDMDYAERKYMSPDTVEM